MASNLRVDSIVPATGTNVSIGTATGGVNIPGVLTYEDVTNVDSIGVITARSSINVNAASSGIGVTINSGGINVAGVITATSFSGIDSDKISEGNTEVETIDTGSDGHVKFSTEGGERLRIGPAGQIGIAGANYGTSGQVLTSQGSGSAVQWASPSGWVFGTAADYDQWNSLTDARFSGWPTNWQQIRISFQNISSNGNAYIQFFVSKSSDPANKISSTYENKSGHFGSSQSIDNDSNSAIMGRFYGTGSAGYSLTGHVNFYNFRNDIVRYEGQCSTNNAAYMYMTNGKVECSTTAQMTHIFFRSQGYSWDSGRFKIDYLFG